MTPVTIKKYEYIDAIRGIAVLAVLFDHTGLLGLSPDSKIFGFLTAQGARGVQLFYIASALTLFLSLHQRAGQEEAPRLDFFIRRFFRIAPLYWLAVVYYIWQNGTGPNYWTGNDHPVTLSAIAANLALVHGAHPYWINSVVPGGWSIGVEMPFYLTVPFLFAAYSRSMDPRKFLRRLLLGSLAGSFAIRLALWHHPLIADMRLWKEYLFLFLPAQFPVFAGGFLAFDVIVSKDKFDLKPLLYWLAPALLVSFFFGRELGVRLIEPHVVVSLFFGAFIVLLERSRPRILVNKAIAYVGKLSYSLYLTHFAAIFLLEKAGVFTAIGNHLGPAGVRFAVAFLAMLAASLPLSWLTKALVEEPGIALGKRLIERIEKDRGRSPKIRTVPLRPI